MRTEYMVVRIKEPPVALGERIRREAVGKVFLASRVSYDLAPEPRTEILVDSEILVLVVMGPQALPRLRDFIPSGAGEIALRPEEVEVIMREREMVPS